MGQIVAATCWLLVHPDGRVRWGSIDFRDDRPRDFWLTRLTRWRWQRWVLRRDTTDNVFSSETKKEMAEWANRGRQHWDEKTGMWIDEPIVPSSCPQEK